MALTPSRPFSPTRPMISDARSWASLSASSAYSPSNPRRRVEGRAMTTLSRAVNSSNRVMIWNEREIPLATIRWGAAPVMSSPSKTTRPRSGL